MTDAELLETFGAERGIVCAVGAGGKKTTLYRLLAAHPGPVAVTASVMTTPPGRRLVEARLFTDAESLDTEVPAAGRQYRRIAYATAAAKSGRVSGVDPARIAALHRAGGFGLTLVKADGARMRSIKAPAEGEPQLVPGTATVLFVVSAGVFGEPLDERIAHRPAELSAVTGCAPGEALRPEHVARLLSDPQGALKGTAGMRVIPVINQVDDGERAALAREAATRALARSDALAHIVLAAMTAAEPVVDIVRRRDGEAN
ncbi:selenium cofactor biosynthesis protein YqeC [Sediminicurvatus halobius]|uniref:Putative selenium-dependent hydroxylase accessory protein YqeC n=1 Tax=Sediminicurvatus halobius TaxID=2182432 RepID=A0A2U2MZ62_9GAMM|nr:selenium cofactor biosynthesis protein YqeC [Spiribacter halobius]PWG62216.1 putative selenium-dependent hydroxylase accessory protein YqeC [Spiribacter halobius]UEX78122.1 putative selenium-dependent hydroxylase accessory protein YqeC [Spiribacter halobius]